MDNQMIFLPLPAELNNPFFFSTKIIKAENDPSKLGIENFMFDALFYNGNESFKPWENQVDSIPIIMVEWEKNKDQLEKLHRNRDQKNTLHLMKKSIGLFLEFLFWSNDRPVSLQQPIPCYPIDYKPVNIEERIAFIISRPNLYHSFRQLSELIMEQEKIYAKKRIKQKSV
jgi:hypothetical protein